jgi:serine/threonine protein kinase
VGDDLARRAGSWVLQTELGKGGQGTVYRAVRADLNDLRRLAKASRSLAFASGDDISLPASLELAKLVHAIGQEAAVKVLHEVGDDQEGIQAKDRMTKEVETMREVRHPHLLHCLEYDDPNLRWYATEYHPGGTLDQHKERYTGRVLKALRALRGVIEGVALLHEHNRVHRDIKPGNIFVASDGRLVLGDFGLIFYRDAEHTRVSGTMEKVGSSDWMPGWALSMRIEDVQPTFDVFGLGKVLYSMVSKIPVLRLWYHQRPAFSLKTMFPNDPAIKWVDHILAKSVVEDEDDMKYKDASELLIDFDRGIAELLGKSKAPSQNTSSPSGDGPISAALLEIDWTLQGNALRALISLENASDQPDTFRQAVLTLDGDSPTDMISIEGALPRLEAFDRKVITLHCVPVIRILKPYELRITLSTVGGRSVSVTRDASPGGRQRI